MDEKAIARFWSKVDKRGPNECWPWTASVHSFGYGSFYVSKSHRAADAHRVSWEIANGPIPGRAHILHSCDNPPCCNPAHLLLGTHADNMRDKDTKRRGNQPRGSIHHWSKLTESQVREILQRLADGEKLQPIAKRYGVSKTAVGLIKTGKNWKHLSASSPVSRASW